MRPQEPGRASPGWGHILTSKHFTRQASEWTRECSGKEVQMYRKAGSARSWAKPLVLSILCGTALISKAQAQFPSPGFNFPSTMPAEASDDQEEQEQEQSVGTILTVP